MPRLVQEELKIDWIIYGSPPSTLPPIHSTQATISTVTAEYTRTRTPLSWKWLGARDQHQEQSKACHRTAKIGIQESKNTLSCARKWLGARQRQVHLSLHMYICKCGRSLALLSKVDLIVVLDSLV
jgi:hypothetical protein